MSFLLLFIHFTIRLILVSCFVIETQLWMFAAASGKLYLILSGKSQLSAIIINTLFEEMNPILIHWSTVSNGYQQIFLPSNKRWSHKKSSAYIA